MVSDVIEWGNHTTQLTWLPGPIRPTDFPYTQVYGVIFNLKGEVLIIKNDDWGLPGGTPEKGERPEDTLSRELMEEADVTVDRPELLGSQKVEYIGSHNPDYEQGDVFHQLRYVAIVKTVHPQTPDPDGGKTYERKFVPIEKVTDYVHWGSIGQAIFNDAAKWFAARK